MGAPGWKHQTRALEPQVQMQTAALQHLVSELMVTLRLQPAAGDESEEVGHFQLRLLCNRAHVDRDRVGAIAGAARGLRDL